MTNVFLGIGGNLGDRRGTMRAAVQALRPELARVQVSSLYETVAWGLTDQPDFLNAVLRGDTSLKPLELLDKIQAIENKLGRVREQHWGHERSISTSCSTAAKSSTNRVSLSPIPT